jgi:hypothetical protein
LSKSQVSAMASELDDLVDGFRNRPLDRRPYTFVWIDALTQKVREGGRTVNAHCLIATGVNAGCREILGVDVTSSEDGVGWLAFLRGLPPTACPASPWSPATTTPGWSAPSPRCCPVPLGSAAGRTSIATCSPGCLRPPSRGCRPWSAPSSSSPTPPRSGPSTPRPSPRSRPSCRRPRPTSTTRVTTSWPSRLPPRGVAADLVQQPPGAAEQGDPPPHRRGRHLPRPRRHHPPGRRGTGGTGASF